MINRIPWEPEYEYTGIVGDEVDETVTHPILFIHGHSRDESDWASHFAHFTQNGFSGSELWAIGFDKSTFRHDELASQLDDFVTNLFETTSAETISIVSHSLGVTVSRIWMYKYDRYDIVTTFIGLAGANHGVSFCPPHTVSKLLPDSHKYKPCEVITKHSFTGTKLDWLNKTVGETPGDVKYYTIRGSDDSYFYGCSTSPKLDGAEQNVLLNTDHDGVRESPESIELIYEWIVNGHTNQ